MKNEDFANFALSLGRENVNVNLRVHNSILKHISGIEPNVERTGSVTNITFNVIPTVAKQKPKLRKKANPKGELENIPNRDGWVRNSNGNEFKRISVWEDNKGNLWVGNGEKAVKVREDTDTNLLGIELPDGTVIEKIPQAPKRIKVYGETFEVWEDYKKSEKYRQVISDCILYVSPNLSMDGAKLQAVKAGENRPIVNENYLTAMELASKVGYGEWESELMHDAEYSLDWIYQVYVKGDRSAMDNKHYLWLQTKANNSSFRVLAGSIHDRIGGVGARGWHGYRLCNSTITFRSSLKRSTD